MIFGVTVCVSENSWETSSFNSDIKRSDLHLSESQRVMVAFPVIPLNAISVRRVVASEVQAVEVGIMTVLVPPGTFKRHCTRLWPLVVVLVASAELLSNMTDG